jgi:hypothetical protein
MPSPIPSGVSNTLDSSSYSFIEEVALYSKASTATIATEPNNDVWLNGGKFVNARWDGKGTIPLGLQWESTSQGLHFYGTPQEKGTFEARFEGDYPDNWVSTYTSGGNSGAQYNCNLTPASGTTLTLTVFAVRFIVTELPQEAFSYGQVLSELIANTSVAQTARRLSWSGTRCIGMRKQNDYFGESKTAQAVATGVIPPDQKAKVIVYHYDAPANYSSPLSSASVRVATGSDITASDYIAPDWVFSSAIVNNTPSTTLLTKETSKANVIAETATEYASYNGLRYDGVTRRTIFNSKIKFSSYSLKDIKQSVALNDYVWGEFIVSPQSGKKIRISMYSTLYGEISKSPTANLELISLGRIQGRLFNSTGSSPLELIRRDEGYGDAERIINTGEANWEYIYRGEVECEQEHYYFIVSPNELALGTLSPVEVQLFIGYE